MTSPLVSSWLSGRYQQESSDPSALTNEEPPSLKQPSNELYQLNCNMEKNCNSVLIKQATYSKQTNQQNEQTY